MNPLAAAYLAAQGWDLSKYGPGPSASESGSGNQSHMINDAQGQSNGYNDNRNNNNTNNDFNALLNNPAVLQALSSQMANGTYNQHPPPASAPSQHQAQDQIYGNPQNLTPGQTTRFGRVSRPPVAPPMQDQLALLQQILNGGSINQNQNQNQNALSSTQSHQPNHQGQAPPYQNGQASSYTGQGQSNQARTNGAKRPHSALREQSLPPQPPARAPPRTAREQSPLVRPVPSTGNGRPRRGDPTSKEERMEQRRIQNTLSAADYRRKKELYIQSLEDRIHEKELEVKAKTEECEKWRQKFVDMEKQHVVLAALWTAAGYSLPDGNGTMPSLDRIPLPTTAMNGRSASTLHGGVRNVPEGRNAPSMSPASMNPPIRSPLPLLSAGNTPNNNSTNFPSPAQQPTPLASASTTLSMGMHAPNHPTMSPLTTLPGSSPAPIDTPDANPFDFGVHLSAFDDFFNWDILPNDDADDQQDADFVPASSPKRDSDSDDESVDQNQNQNQPNKKRKKGKGKSKARSNRRTGGDKDKDTPTNEDDDDFIDPEEDEEDLFMPITDVEVPPGQMQLVEKATQDVMSTLGVDSQAQLTGVMQKIVDAGDGLTGDQLEKMKSVLRWYTLQASATRPS